MEQHPILGYHETMETHEIINFKTVSLMKSKLMQGVCFDNELKQLMDKEVQLSTQALNELLDIYKGARTNTTLQ